MRPTIFFAICASCLISSAIFTSAQFWRPSPPKKRPTPASSQSMRKASDLIHKQEPVKVNQALLKQCTPDNVHIIVSIPKQRAYLMLNDEIVIDEPISSGKRGHGTPTGHFSVMEKTPTIVRAFTATSSMLEVAWCGPGSARESMLRPAAHIMWVQQ